MTGGLSDCERQADAEVGGNRLQLLRAIHPLRVPVSIPYALKLLADSGDPWSGTIYTLGVIELLRSEITDSEMRKV